MLVNNYRLHLQIFRFQCIFVLLLWTRSSAKILNIIIHDAIRVSDFCPKAKHCATGAHIVCSYDPNKKFGPSCLEPVRVEVNDNIKTVILNMLNAYRMNVTGGISSRVPRGYGIPRLQWDADLATFAQIRADQCPSRTEKDMCRATSNFPDPDQVILHTSFGYETWTDPQDTFDDTTILGENKVIRGISYALRKAHYNHQVTREEVLSYSGSQKPTIQQYANFIHGRTTHVGCGVNGHTLLASANAKVNHKRNLVIVCNFSHRPLRQLGLYYTTQPLGEDFTKKCGCSVGYGEGQNCLCEPSSHVTTTLIPPSETTTVMGKSSRENMNDNGILDHRGGVHKETDIDKETTSDSKSDDSDDTTDNGNDGSGKRKGKNEKSNKKKKKKRECCEGGGRGKNACCNRGWPGGVMMFQPAFPGVGFPDSLFPPGPFPRNPPGMGFPPDVSDMGSSPRPLRMGSPSDPTCKSCLSSPTKAPSRDRGNPRGETNHWIQKDLYKSDSPQPRPPRFESSNGRAGDITRKSSQRSPPHRLPQRIGQELPQTSESYEVRYRPKYNSPDSENILLFPNPTARRVDYEEPNIFNTSKTSLYYNLKHGYEKDIGFPVNQNEPGHSDNKINTIIELLNNLEKHMSTMPINGDEKKEFELKMKQLMEKYMKHQNQTKNQTHSSKIFRVKVHKHEYDLDEDSDFLENDKPTKREEFKDDVLNRVEKFKPQRFSTYNRLPPNEFNSNEGGNKKNILANSFDTLVDKTMMSNRMFENHEDLRTRNDMVENYENSYNGYNDNIDYRRRMYYQKKLEQIQKQLINLNRSPFARDRAIRPSSNYDGTLSRRRSLRQF